MTILETVRGPRDLKALSAARLRELSDEIRHFLVHAVARTGGHPGPNLGVVELTIALHRVFDSPVDRILWDTGHQSYVHKLLTGRQDLSKLRGKGGLSGYPSREESEHDVIENSQASTALGWADGLAKARRARGEQGHVVAVVGDGALTGGMAWEALNNIAAAKDRPLIIVVNDNERSYAPTIGGLADHLATLRTTDGYEKTLAWGKDVLLRTPVVGRPLYEALHGAKKGSVALHRCGVTFVLDRAGVTGADGASHNGMWDLSVLQVVPGLAIAAPRDADQLRAQLREAVAVADVPTLVRFPKESVGPAVPAVDRVGGIDVLHRSEGAEVLLVAVGAMAPVCLQTAELLAARGIGCTVVDPRWVKPVDPELPGLAARHRLVAVVEDNSRAGGVGAAVALALGDADVDVPVRGFGIPEQFLPHAKRGEVLADIGLTPVEIAGRIGASLTAGAERREREEPGKGGERARRGAAGDPAGEKPSKETHA
ncbi:1-deoxy-D-xylulose-5-phosphate synthase N-terminal domain-containing protein [Streptomyces glaucescens]|uniref:1-deoxy-D-xylulose-5-phosphate synthase N-terminal domain-containing protein n=1 Tax=Streptomyces glaucescens TaxID=1907 RepID=UPI000A37004D|nr:1-deoxy-D-xylulose-5-phosphate synthase N-terminal domain-containing protein [Streptomyces glaucescens]